MITENRPTNASLSTMWALTNYPDLNDFFEISKQLGFQKIELNHQVNSAMLSRVRLDHYQISSVHEPCPADISTKDLVDRDWLISSISEDFRLQGVGTVKRSIRLAYDLGAPTVVIHCGTIPYNINHENKLRTLFKNGLNTSEEYQDIKLQFIQLRTELVGPRLNAVKKSLNELIEYGDQYKIRLGLENRYHYMDIPSIDEMGELLSLADSDRLGFIL